MALAGKSIDIIIPTKDNVNDLTKCLYSLHKNLDFSSFNITILVVSDGSTPANNLLMNNFIKSLETINKKIKILTLILPKEKGFTKAVNIGINYSLSKKKVPDYIGFLHDDTYIFKNWVENLIKPLEENATIYGASPITYNEIDNQCISKCINFFSSTINNIEIKRLDELLINVRENYTSLINNYVTEKKIELEKCSNLEKAKSDLIEYQKTTKKKLTPEEETKLNQLKAIVETKLNEYNAQVELTNQKERLFQENNDAIEVIIKDNFKDLSTLLLKKNFNIDKEPERYIVASNPRDEENYIDIPEFHSSGRLSLFSSIFKSCTFSEFGLFDEDLLSSLRMEDEFLKRMILKEKGTCLVPGSFVFHKCKSLTSENINLQTTRIKRNATLSNIEIKKSLNQKFVKKNTVIYTCILENEKMPSFKKYNENYDYVCFTNNEGVIANRLNLSPWTICDIRKIEQDLGFIQNSIKLKEFIKVNPHLFLNNYDLSIWFDTMKFTDIIYDFTEIIRSMNKDIIALALESTTFDCSYKELIYNKKNNLILSDEYNKTLLAFRSYRFPQNAGLMDTSLLIRKHNDIYCKSIMNKIWYYISNFCSNDKLFFNLCFWLFKKSYMSIPNTLFFKWMNQHIGGNE